MGSERLSILAAIVSVACVVLGADSALAAQCGKAAWYDLGGKTANGESSSGNGMTAAHRTLPFGTKVRVENLSNGKSVIVRINDRGPFVGGRVIDVTRAAAEEIDMVRSGIANVRVSVVEGNAKIDQTCKDPGPRVMTAEAVAKDPPRAKAATATATATPSPNESRPARGNGNALVASASYDEGTGTPARNRASDRARLNSEPDREPVALVEIDDRPADVPLPRPRPAVFNDSPIVVASAEIPPQVFNRTLALRFIDAFAPTEPGMELDIPALGYAPLPPVRGAVITE